MTNPTPGPLNPLLTDAPEYPFTALGRRRDQLAPPGLRIINFGIGDPREVTPPFIRKTMADSIPEMSSYPDPNGQRELREAAAGWYRRRFGVSIDPETQLLPANGTKEAVFLLPLVVISRAPSAAKRTIVIPSPHYPVYLSGAEFAGADVHFVPLRSEDGWRFNPDLVPEEVWKRTALLWINSPHNPTGAMLPAKDFERLAAMARQYGFWLASDEAYAEVYFDRRPTTLLQCGFENGIVFHTLSKRSAMTGFRSGFMAGDERLIRTIRLFRPHVGTATPDFVQRAAIAAWNDDEHPVEQRARYAAKRDLFLAYFAKRGWTHEASEASFYLWWKTPWGTDVTFVDSLLRRGLVAMPGSFMGRGGEGFMRLALVPTLDDCREAIRRLDTLEGPEA